MIRMAITSSGYRSGDASRLASAGVTYIQLRDKSLPAAKLAAIARTILSEIRDTPTRLLINSRADIALATGAHGVHLTAAAVAAEAEAEGELTPAQIRKLFSNAHAPAPIVSISCRSAAEAIRARTLAADLILFAPVFEKRIDGALISAGLGLAALQEACIAAAPIPVLALGGITTANIPDCLAAGAAGIAAIRLFRDEPGALPSTPPAKA